MNKKKLVIITGHPDKESLCFENAKVIEESAKEKGLLVTRFNSYDFPLLYQHPYKPDKGYGKEFDNPSKALLDADFVCVVCPLWNFSVPAGLKNFLEGSLQMNKHFTFSKKGVPKGLMKAKKVVAVYTMGSKKWQYLLAPFMYQLDKQLKLIFKVMCGVGSYERHFLCSVKYPMPYSLDSWFKELKSIKFD